jgi:hypothetical protein
MFVLLNGMSVDAYQWQVDHSSTAAATPTTTPARSAAETYTGQAVHAAQTAQSGSDKTTSANEAIVAIAAELELSYQANSNNSQATRNASQAISARFGNGSQIQQWVGSALRMVLQGTPTERATNQVLAQVDQAGTELTGLQTAQANGGKVSNGQIAAALLTYQNLQQKLLAACENEIDARQTACYATPEAAAAAASPTLPAGQVSDPELTTAMQAAVIALKITSANGIDAQILALGKNLPASVDPSVKSVVMSDPAVQKIVNSYVGNTAQQVQQANQAFGPETAANTLQQIVQTLQTSVPSTTLCSQLAALVINRCMPNIQNMIGQLPATVFTPATGPAGQWGEGTSAPDTQASVTIAEDLSQVVEVAAASGNTSTGQYDTPQITAAVNGVAKAIATHPQAKLGAGLTAAVGQGYATLALATADQIQQLTSGELSSGSGVPQSAAAFASWKNTAVNDTLGDVNTGIIDFQSYIDSTTKSLAASTPALAQQGQYSGDVTDATFNGGVSAMINGLPASKLGPAVAPVAGLKKSVSTDLATVTNLGYRLVSVDQAVSFYQPALGSKTGYTAIENSLGSLMSDPNSIAAILASPAAKLSVFSQNLRQALTSTPGTQYYSTGAQTFGDLVEFLAESYWANSAAQTPGSLVLQDDAGNQLILDAARIGHSPFAVAWLAGGSLQGLLTDFVIQNSHPAGPDPTLRKTLTILIVGGFGTLHTAQAIAAAGRWLASAGLPPGLGGNGAVKAGTWLDNATRLTVEPTVQLIQGLTVLMGLATLSDAANLSYDLSGLNAYPGGTSQTAFNATAHGLNFTADVALLRLQARGWAQQALGKAVLSEPSASAAFATAFQNAMLDALGQQQLVASDTTVSPVLLQAAQQFLGRNRGTQAVNQLRDTYQVASGGGNWFKTGGQFGRAAFLRRNALTSQQYMASLSDTAQQSLAAQWALEPGNAAEVGSPTLRWVAQSKALNLFVNVANKLFGSKPSSAAGDSEAVPDLLSQVGEEGIGDGTATATDAAAEGTVGLTNPIGWTVNALYFATTVGTTFYNQYANVKVSKQDEYAFLRGTGIDDAHAKALSAHGFFSGKDASSGFVAAYGALGGDPSQFVHYVNSMPIATLNKTLSALSPVTSAKLPATAAKDYWTLPVNPNDPAQRKFDPNLTYDTSTQTWEDKSLQMHFANGDWVKDGTVPTGDMPELYDPSSQDLEVPTDQGSYEQMTIGAPPYNVTPEVPRSTAGLRAWFIDNGVPLPPNAVKAPAPQAPAPKTRPAAASVKVGVYGEAPIDSTTLWGIAQANLDSLLDSTEKTEAAADQDSTATQVANFAEPNLIALNPQYPSLTSDPNLLIPGWTLNIDKPAG